MDFLLQNYVFIFIQTLMYFCESINTQLCVYFIVSISTILILFKVSIIISHYDFIHFSGPTKRLGEKIITGLGIGAAAAGTYQGTKEVIKDVRSILNSGGSGSKGSGSNNSGPQNSNNGNNGNNGSNQNNTHEK